MQLRDDRRGQAIQIGAVLLLGAVVLAFSVYQATVVPEQNSEIEFKHSQTVQDQLSDVRNAIVSTGQTGDGRSLSVALGTQYPSRIIALNPPPPIGSLGTVGSANASFNVTVANARASGETGDFWSGVNRSYNTGAIVYRPGYNEYQGAPTTWYENSVLFNQFRSANLTVSGQQLVEDNRISLVTLNGSYYASRSGNANLDIRPVSASPTTVTVTNETATSNVTVSIATRLNESAWRTLLDGEFVEDGGHVTALETTPVAGTEYRRLHLVFERGEPYTLQLSRTGIGTGVERTDAAYLTDIGGNGTSVPEGGSVELTVQVRDAFDNPIGNDFVYAGSSLTGSSVTPTQKRSAGDGTVTLTYEAPADIDGTTQTFDRVNASLSVGSAAVDDAGFNASTPQNVSMVVRVDNTDGSGLNDGSNESAYTVYWQNPSAQTGVTCTGGANGYCTVNASQAGEVTLKTGTDPAVDNGRISYALNNTTVGVVSPDSNLTASNGTASTTFTPAENGNVSVYASGGGSGDQLDIRVVGVENTAFVGEVGTTTIDQSTAGAWKEISLEGIYDDPVVIAKPLEYPVAGDEPAYPRIRNVGPTSFEVRVDEWDGVSGQDGIHSPPTNVSYLVFEKGTHELQNGSMVDVGTLSLSGGDFQSVAYNQSFASTPVVFSQSQTVNDPTDVVIRQDSVGTGSFDLKFQQDDGGNTGGHGVETVGYIAIEQNQSVNDGALWETDTTPDAAVFGVEDYSFEPTQFYQIPFNQPYSGPPAFVAQMQTENGGDTAYERFGTLNATDARVAIDETPADGERNHGGSETVGYFAFERTGPIYQNGTSSGGSGGTGGAPTVQSVAFNDSDDTITDAEANSNVRRSLTLTFDETMDTSVPPTIDHENVTDGGNTYTVVSGSWVDSTTYEQVLEYTDNDVDTPVTVVVSGAEDTTGNQMTTERPFSYTVDTRVPGASNGVRIEPPAINANNQTAVDATLVNPGSLDGDETAVLSIVNTTTGDTVTVQQQITTAGGADTTFTDIDVSSLPDGTVIAEGFVRDDAGNTGGSVQNDETPKDTTVPTINTFDATNPSGTTVEVTLDASESLSTITIDLADTNGTTVATLTKNNVDNTNCPAGGPCVYTWQVDTGGYSVYEATLLEASDPLNNDGASGQSASVETGPSTVRESFEGASALSGLLNFTSPNDPEYVGIRADNQDGAGDISRTGTQAAYVEGPDSGRSGPGILQSRTLDTSGDGSVTVAYAVKQGDGTGSTPEDESNNANGEVEDLFVEYRDSNGNWVLIERFEANGTGGPYAARSVSISDAQALHDNFAIRFRQPEATGSDPWHVDDVCVLPGGGSCASTSSTPSISMRLDDLSNLRNNAPRYRLSYDVANVGSNFENVTVTFEAQDGNPSDTIRDLTATRNAVTWQPGFGNGEVVDATVTVYTDDGSGPTVATERTLTDTIDAQTTASNDDLSTSSSVSLVSSSIDDRSNTNANKVRYRFDYDASAGTDFASVLLGVLNTNGNGATTVVERTSSTDNSVDVNPGDGTNNQYRLAILVLDSNGVVVDVTSRLDNADGNGP